MTEELKEDVNNMCNYSDAILRMGKEEGESLLATLIIKLKELGRTDDVYKAAADKEYREKLYKEFQLA